MDIVEFLTARLRDDQAHADQAAKFAGREWSELWSGAVETADDMFITNDSGVSRHIERYDPARVLADVAAKQAILALHAPTDDDPGGPPYCIECQRYDGAGKPCPTILLLAAPYADHPDYDPAWAVTSPATIGRP